MFIMNLKGLCSTSFSPGPGSWANTLWMIFHCCDRKENSAVNSVISIHISLGKANHMTTPNSKGARGNPMNHMPRKGRNKYLVDIVDEQH